MFKKFQMLGKAIKAVKPNVPTTASEKAKSKLKILKQKTKASGAKLKQTLFEKDNPKFKGKDFTFKTKTGKSESNKEAYKRIQGENTKAIKSIIDDAFKNVKDEKKATGGRVGRKFGNPKPKTNVEKIKEAFGSKKGLKKIDPKKQKGLAKLKKARPDVVRKMGYFKKGGVS